MKSWTYFTADKAKLSVFCTHGIGRLRSVVGLTVCSVSASVITSAFVVYVTLLQRPVMVTFLLMITRGEAAQPRVRRNKSIIEVFIINKVAVILCLVCEWAIHAHLTVH